MAKENIERGRAKSYKQILLFFAVSASGGPTLFRGKPLRLQGVAAEAVPRAEVLGHGILPGLRSVWLRLQSAVVP